MSLIVTLSDPESNNLIATLKPGRNRLLALLMLDAGLRVGEAVRLRWFDIFDGESARSVIRLPPSITKTNTSRNLPTTDRLKTCIGNHFQWTPQFEPDFTRSWVFPGRENGAHITTRQVRRIIFDASRKALGFSIFPHALRHTFATRLMRCSSVRVVQDLLGHKSLKSTQIYTHPDSQDLIKAITSLNSRQT